MKCGKTSTENKTTTHMETTSLVTGLSIVIIILCCDLLHSVIDGISFYGLEAGAVDHFDDLLFGHFYFAAGFDGVAVGEFAAVGDGAVEVVGAEVEGGLGRGFAEHHPVGLDVVEVVEHQA